MIRARSLVEILCPANNQIAVEIIMSPNPPIWRFRAKIKIPGRLNVSMVETGDSPVLLSPLVETKRASRKERDAPSFRLNGSQSKIANPTVNRK